MKARRRAFAATITAVVFFSAVAIAMGTAVDFSPSGEGATVAKNTGARGPGLDHGWLPCTGPREAVNFETFSAGAAPVGLPLTETIRRCDEGSGDAGANYVSYIYGDCMIAESATGCSPPLEVQVWPACQRSLADYSFEGRPLPHRKLPSDDAAEVVEFAFGLDNRIEVYTRSSTIVIFANQIALARKAVGLLRPIARGKPPLTNPAALAATPVQGLAAPAEGSIEGQLSCGS
jgi:hypothetical protein